jgi:hypothetical protein
MIIGGLANSIYGIPRQTFDIDIKFSLSENEINDFIRILVEEVSIIPENPLSFLKETGVIPVEVSGVRVDLIMINLPYEQEALRRSKRQTIYSVDAYITSAEDLIIQKAISPRQRDWMDIEGIVENNGSTLDWSYILFHVKQLSEFLVDPSIYSKMEHLKSAN